MIQSDAIYKFFDNEDSRVLTSVLEWNRTYSFTAVNNTFSTTSKNTYVFQMPSYFPSSLTGFVASASYMFSTPSNSTSSYWYHSLFMLYKLGAIQNFNFNNGAFTLTSNLASVTSTISALSANNIGLTNLNVVNDNIITSAFTANYLYVFQSEKLQYGDGIRPTSFSAYIGNTLFGYDAVKSKKNVTLLTITHPSFSASTVFAWLLRDFGRLYIYTNNNSLSATLTGINQFVFDNTVYIANSTIHITMLGEEFNYSENTSFYDKFFNSGRLPNTYITTVGLYNDQNQLLAVAKLANPIKKYAKMPITIKIKMDYV